MVKFFPQGAVQTRDQVASLIGHEVFAVYGLGSGSYITRLKLVGPIKDVNLGYGDKPNWSPFICVMVYTKSGDTYHSDQSLGDRNVTASHNDHYWFVSEKDAEAYLEYAKSNSREMGDFG